jgi:hypothetical protein
MSTPWLHIHCPHCLFLNRALVFVHRLLLRTFYWQNCMCVFRFSQQCPWGIRFSGDDAHHWVTDSQCFEAM